MLWLAWHRTVAVNAWRGRVCGKVDQSCLYAQLGRVKQFYIGSGNVSRQGKPGHGGLHILHLLLPPSATRPSSSHLSIANPRINGRRASRQNHPPYRGTNMDQEGRPRQFYPSWKHCIFACRIPRRFREVSRLWLLLRGVVTWTLWIERNDAAFNGILWPQEKKHIRRSGSTSSTMAEMHGLMP